MARKSSRRSISEDKELESAYRHVSGHKGKYQKRKSHNSTPIIVAICIAIIAVIVCIAAGYLYYLDADLDGIILNNVSIAGVDVGGMSQTEAITAVRNATENTFSSTPMVVTVNDSQAEIPCKYVGNFDVRGAVKDAYRFGNTGSSEKRQQEQQQALNNGYAVDLTPHLDLNEKGIRQVLSELGAQYSSTLSQSSYEVKGTAPSQTLVISLGVPEYGLDLNQLYNQVLSAYSKNQFQVTGECGMIAPDPIDLDAIHAQYYTAPINAYYDTSTNEIVEGVCGYGFDLDAAKRTVEEAKYGTTLEIPFVEILPECSKETLTAMLYRDTLATYTGASESDDDRDTNLRLACEAIDGLILYPGDVFSYNDTLGERTAARGYRPGPSYSGNQTVTTIGGGICQVSSALYYCALKAELQILLRENHGFMPSYMPVGLDATVSWGTIDFRFKNTLDYPVRIEASASDGETTVSIIGTELRDYRVELESDILSTTEYSTTYKTMRANNSGGYKDGDFITEPYTGYEVDTYLCKYSNDSDTQLSKELIAHSVYKKRDAVVCKIEGASSGNTTEIVLPGIGGGVTDDDGALPD